MQAARHTRASAAERRQVMNKDRQVVVKCRMWVLRGSQGLELVLTGASRGWRLESVSFAAPACTAPLKARYVVRIDSDSAWVAATYCSRFPSRASPQLTRRSRYHACIPHVVHDQLLAAQVTVRCTGAWRGCPVQNIPQDCNRNILSVAVAGP